MRDLFRSRKWLIAFLIGLFLFVMGLFLLRFNPYWRMDPGQPGIDHRVYFWNGIGHLSSAAGLLCLAFTPVLLLSRVFSRLWYYYTLIVVVVIAWWAMFGIEQTCWVRYGWDSGMGITEFTITSSSAEGSRNWLWERIVRSQVEPELRMWLSGSPLRRTHGSVNVRVFRIVPIALPTLDCDCFRCCVEEDKVKGSD